MFYSPLRYPGGKGKISSFIESILYQNNLVNCTYIEPYSGGAGVALTLLLKGFVQHIVINDIDPVIYAFWDNVINDTEQLCDMIQSTRVDIDEWHRQREINSNYMIYSSLEVGFSTFFLNRTNRSGIIKAGVIGGLRQTGKYKINARFNKDNLIKRVKLIGKHRKNISVYNKDALELTNLFSAEKNKKMFFYFDPPYFNKGQTLYKNSYTEDDHALVAIRIQELKHPWLVTYDDVPSIRNLYSTSPTLTMNVNYSANLHLKGHEVIFYNNILPPQLNI